MKASHTIKPLASQLAKSLMLVFTGNMVAAVLGFLTVLIISRELSVSDFGLFNIAISIMLIASQISGLGMEKAIMKFTSFYLGEGKKNEAVQVLKVTLFVRIITTLIFMVLIYSTAEMLSSKVFYYPGLTPLIKLASIGILAATLLSYLRFSLYASQEYRRAVILQLLVDIGKLSGVFFLIFFLKLDAFVALAIFAFSPFLGVLVGFRQFYRVIVSAGKPTKKLLKELFSYGKWLFISKVCKIILPYVAIFLIAKMLDIESVGIYCLALNLTRIFPILTNSLNAVMLPEFSRFKELERLEDYIKKSLKISFFIVMSVVPFLFFSQQIILFFFGSRYLESVHVFNWLLLGNIVGIINSTNNAALYSINKPNIVTIANLAKVGLMILGCYLLIPYLGVLAPAILLLIIRVGTFGYFTAYLFKHIHSAKERNMH